MTRSAILPFVAPLRALRATLAPLSVPGGDAQSGPPSSMFDSAGATGRSIEVPETEAGAQVLHDHLASSPEVASLLMIDPAGIWGYGVMHALGDATGSPVDRLRVVSNGGLLVRAVVDETLLPAGNGPHRLVRCLHGSQRPADRRAIFGALLAHSQICAVLIGPMPESEADALIEEMHRIASLPAAAGTRWLFYIGADHRGLEHRIEGHHWPQSPVVVHARPLGRSLTSVWNSLYEAWIRLSQ